MPGRPCGGKLVTDLSQNHSGFEPPSDRTKAGEVFRLGAVLLPAPEGVWGLRTSIQSRYLCTWLHDVWLRPGLHRSAG